MRMGKKKQPTYRIVASDSRSARDGRFIEIIGTYAPRDDPSTVSVDEAKALDWLKKGAQPTETVKKILQISGAWAQFRPNDPPPPPPKAPKAKSTPAPAPSAPSAAAEPAEVAVAEPAEPVAEAASEQAPSDEASEASE
jgi:small subunit ribosomal protein S16